MKLNNYYITILFKYFEENEKSQGRAQRENSQSFPFLSFLKSIFSLVTVNFVGSCGDTRHLHTDTFLTFLTNERFETLCRESVTLKGLEGDCDI